MDNIIRDFKHDKDIQKYFPETEEAVGLKFDFYTNLSFFGYAKDGNTKIPDLYWDNPDHSNIIKVGCQSCFNKL